MGLILVENKDTEFTEFHRDTTGKLYTKKAIYRPYFYYYDSNGKYRSILNEPLSRVTFNSLPDFKFERDKYGKTWESDVVFTNRYLIDSYYKTGIDKSPIRRLYIDIEVDDSKGFEPVKKREMPITLITMQDSFSDKIATLSLNDTDNDNISGSNIVCFNGNEKKLLQFFVKTLLSKDPDIITAWNVNFDIMYILQRMQFYGMDLNILSRINKTVFMPQQDVVKIKGRIILDLKEGYKLINQNQLSSYALEFVAQYEFNEGKEKYSGKIIDMDIDDQISYNVRDVELLSMIDNKLKIIEFFDLVRRLACVNFHDVFSSKRVVDSYLLCMAKQKGIILPSTEFKEKHNIQGARVKETKCKRYENIVGFDFKSLYPSVIMQYNISYETYVVNPTDTRNLININDMYYFRKDITGFLPESLKTILDMRKYYKKLKSETDDKIEEHSYDLTQQALKVIANSMYGVLTSPYFRLYNYHLGEAITERGRHLITKAEQITENLGYDVILIDTDSVYVDFGANSLNEALEYGNYLYDIFSNSWDDILKKSNAHPNIAIEMELEKIYYSLITTGAKKRYAGLISWKDGKYLNEYKLDTKGLDVVRSDFPESARKFLKDIIIRLLKGADNNEIRQEISKFKKEFKNNEPENIGFPTSVKKPEEYKNTPIQLRAAQISEKYLGININWSGKIKYFFVKETPRGMPFSDVWVFNNHIPEGFKLDWDRFFQRIIDNPLENLLKACNLSQNPTIWEYT